MDKDYWGLKKSIERIVFTGEPDGFIEISKYIRIYYHVNLTLNDDEEHAGFYFVAIEVTGCDSTSLEHSEKCCWDDGNRSFDVLYSGDARRDGMRHLFMGSENEGGSNDKGYVYYPDIEEHIKILQWVRNLELKYCDVRNEDVFIIPPLKTED